MKKKITVKLLKETSQAALTEDKREKTIKMWGEDTIRKFKETVPEDIADKLVDVPIKEIPERTAKLGLIPRVRNKIMAFVASIMDPTPPLSQADLDIIANQPEAEEEPIPPQTDPQWVSSPEYKSEREKIAGGIPELDKETKKDIQMRQYGIEDDPDDPDYLKQFRNLQEIAQRHFKKRK